MKIESILPYAALGCAFVSGIYLKKLESYFKVQSIAQRALPPISFSVINIPNKIGITSAEETKKFFKMNNIDQGKLFNLESKILR